VTARRVLALPSQPGAAVVVWDVGRNLQPLGRASRGSLAEVTGAASRAGVLVLVPTEEVLLLPRVVLPPASGARLGRALPYAVENWVAGDVDAQHVAWTRRRGAGDAFSVAVAARERVAQWLDLLEEVGVRPVAMLPDALGLAWEPGVWSVLVDGERALVRTGACDGFATGTAELVPWLRAAVDAADEAPRLIRMVTLDAGGGTRDPMSRDAAGGVPVERVPAPPEGLAGVMTGLARDTGPDLLQGEFRRAVEVSGRVARPWRVAAVLLLASAVLHTAGLAWEASDLSARAGSAAARAERLFRDAFPEVGRVVDVRTQTSQRLQALRAGAARDESGFLALLAQVSGPLAASGAELRGLRYEDGRLDLELRSAAVADFEALRAATGARAVDVRTQAGAPGERVVTGRLQVGGVR
jgi:general secretion pathway protein L